MNDLFVYTLVDDDEQTVADVVLCDTHVALRRMGGQMLEPLEAARPGEVCEDCQEEDDDPTRE